jgi:hypothetical protein
MTLIRVPGTWDITILLPYRNLVPRFMKEGEHKKTMEDALIVEIR